ncbi:unnamed protein product, partial [Rotaria sp. Silwood2]
MKYGRNMQPCKMPKYDDLRSFSSAFVQLGFTAINQSELTVHFKMFNRQTKRGH